MYAIRSYYATFRNDLENSDIKMDLGKFVETVKEMNLRNSIFMDNTASADIAEIYKPMVELKIPVVASNKIMASSPLEKYIAFKQAAKKNNVMFLNETGMHILVKRVITSYSIHYTKLYECNN